jgi:hypothetical protein
MMALAMAMALAMEKAMALAMDLALAMEKAMALAMDLALAMALSLAMALANMHKQDGLAKIHNENAPFNHYETKCGIHANYDNVAFLWTNVTCQRCLIFKPEKITCKTNYVLSNERKEILIKTYKELYKLRFNMHQMVAEMRRLNLVTQTGKEINAINLESFLRRNNL